MIALSHYEDSELIVLLRDLAGDDKRAELEAQSKLAGWVPDITGKLATMEATSAAPVVPAPEGPPLDPVILPPTLKQIDIRVEGGLRCIRDLFRAAIHQAVADEDDARAARLTQVEGFVFDQGMGFVRGTYLAQCGSVTRLITLARHPDIASDVRGLSLNSVPYARLVDRLEVHNNTLFERVRLGPELPDSTPALPTLRSARVDAIAVLNTLFDLIPRVYVDRDADPRFVKLMSMRRNLDDIVRRRITARVTLPPSPSIPPSDPPA